MTIIDVSPTEQNLDTPLDRLHRMLSQMTEALTVLGFPCVCTPNRGDLFS